LLAGRRVWFAAAFGRLTNGFFFIPDMPAHDTLLPPARTPFSTKPSSTPAVCILLLALLLHVYRDHARGTAGMPRHGHHGIRVRVRRGRRACLQPVRCTPRGFLRLYSAGFAAKGNGVARQAACRRRTVAQRVVTRTRERTLSPLVGATALPRPPLPPRRPLAPACGEAAAAFALHTRFAFRAFDCSLVRRCVYHATTWLARWRCSTPPAHNLQRTALGCQYVISRLSPSPDKRLYRFQALLCASPAGLYHKLGAAAPCLFTNGSPASCPSSTQTLYFCFKLSVSAVGLREGRSAGEEGRMVLRALPGSLASILWRLARHLHMPLRFFPTTSMLLPFLCHSSSASFACACGVLEGAIASIRFTVRRTGWFICFGWWRRELAADLLISTMPALACTSSASLHSLTAFISTLLRGLRWFPPWLRNLHYTCNAAALSLFCFFRHE